MLKLMRLNEATITPRELFELPVFKGLLKTMGDYTTTVDDFVKNLGDYSATLKSRGIASIDDMLAAARKFQEANKDSYGQLLDNGLLLQRYILETGVLKEIEESLITKNLDAISKKTTEAFATMTDELNVLGESLPDSADEIGEAIGVAEKDLASLKDTQEELAKATKKIDEAVTKIDERIAEIPVVNKPTKANAELLVKLNKIKKEYNKFKTIIQKQKDAVDGCVEQMEARASRENQSRITWEGQTFDASNLTPMQRFLFFLGADKLPSFVMLIARFFIRLAHIRKGGIPPLLQTELMRNIAKLKELNIALRTYNTQQIIDLILIYNRETATLIENLRAKTFDYVNVVDEGNLIEYFKQMGKGSVGDLGIYTSTAAKTDLDKIWTEISSMLQEQVNKKLITQEEMGKILTGIKTTYSKTNAAGEVVADGGFAGGLFVLRQDIETMGKAAGIDLKIDLSDELKTSVEYVGKDYSLPARFGRFFDDTFKQLTGFTTAKYWGNAMKGFLKIAVREALFGLPFNLKKYLTPFARQGLNIRGLGSTILTFVMAKAVGSMIFAGISAYLSWAYLRWTNIGISDEITPGTFDVGLAKQEIWDITIGEWRQETQKYRELDVSEMLADLFKDDFSEEEKENRVSKLKYYSDVNREWGPFKIRVWESIVKITSITQSRPDAPEWERFEEEQSKKIKEVTKSKAAKEVEEFESSVYTMTPDEQKAIAGIISNNFTIMVENGSYSAKGLDKTTRDKILERYFIKFDFNGMALSDIGDKTALAKTYLNAVNYRGFPCVCKNKLAFETTYLDFGDEKKAVNKPICDDYVRIFEYDRSLFTDADKLPPVYDKVYGYLTGVSAKSNTQVSTDWHKLIYIKDELK